MFVVLDTDHYTDLTNDSDSGRKAQRRISATFADVFITIVSVQEVVQGWLALINRRNSGHDQIPVYGRFQHSLETINKLAILPFDETAANIFRIFCARDCE